MPNIDEHTFEMLYATVKIMRLFGIEKNTLAPAHGRYIAPWIKMDGKYDLEHFNPAFFGRLRDFVSQAGKLGIIVEATLFTSIYDEGAWILSPFNAANNLTPGQTIPTWWIM